jgi:Protein of unknown function (DUF4058)
MAGSFPGMDPYLEFQVPWPDFHNRLIAQICNELGARLPASYVARVDERIEVATSASGLHVPSVWMSWLAASRREPRALASSGQVAQRSRLSRSWLRFLTATPMSFASLG